MDSIRSTRLLLGAAAVIAALVSPAIAADPWVIYEGADGPGKGKHVVLISGDEEYRSEEALPQLGKILAKHHGFKCTVLFPIGKDGVIDPVTNNNIPGLEALRTADLMIIATRFRDLPDDQMKEIADYVDSGKPIIGLRTATHAFNLKPESKYLSYSWNDKATDGGFGRRVLGETWVAHHGEHGQQSTRGIVSFGGRKHPILTGIFSGDIWGPTDVYEVRLPLAGDSQTLILGQVVEDMTPEGKPLATKNNDPMMPVAWVRTFSPSEGKTAKVFTTTMGAATDLSSAGVRRLLVNATYWATDLDDKISPGAVVDLVGEYKPTEFGFGKFIKDVKPEAHAMP